MAGALVHGMLVDPQGDTLTQSGINCSAVLCCACQADVCQLRTFTLALHCILDYKIYRYKGRAAFVHLQLLTIYLLCFSASVSIAFCEYM